MTKPEDIAPSPGVNANSYEWILRVGTIPAGGGPITWLTYPDITALQPNPTDRTSDGSTYAHKGQEDSSIIGESFNLTLNAKVIKNQDGDLHPALALLSEAANAKLPGGNPAMKVIAVQYYHYSVSAWAWEYTAQVSWTRTNTGNADNEFLSLTLASKGDRKVIPNPAIQPETPAEIETATPSGAETGDWVNLTGSGFLRTTGVTVGGEDATAHQIISGGQMFIQVPDGASGSAPIVVTTPAGTSNSFAYTRG